MRTLKMPKLLNTYEAYADKPTVLLKTLKPGAKFWFSGDWRTDAGIYTLDHFDDDEFPIVKECKESEVDTGTWFSNVSVVPVNNESATGGSQ